MIFMLIFAFMHFISPAKRNFVLYLVMHIEAIDIEMTCHGLVVEPYPYEKDDLLNVFSK